MRAQANGIEIEYETFGDPSDPPLLLVMGLGCQLVWWNQDFVQAFVDRGFHVIIFDNRDVGLSTKIETHIDLLGAVAGYLQGDPIEAPYHLSDMAADAWGLCDALGLERVNLFGASMGGMIVQQMAIDQPDRVRSMCSIMSTTGEPEYGQGAPEAMAALLTPPPTDRAGVIEASSRYSIWASKKYYNAADARERAAADYDRSFYPEGSSRQLAAIFASGRRAEGLRKLKLPTLVIHGRDDTLISPSGGQRTAELVDGAHLFLVADMGHDLPSQLDPFFISVITAHTRWADSLPKGK